MPRTIHVWVQLNEASQPIEHDAINTYVKGPLFCVYEGNNRTVKYPVANIWRVIEEYGFHGSKEA